MEEVKEKNYIDKHDIMKLYDCGESSAMNIIRGIKSVSDSLGIKGKVTKQDYEVWLNRNLIKKEKQAEVEDINISFSNILSLAIKKELSNIVDQDLKTLLSAKSN